MKFRSSGERRGKRPQKDLDQVELSDAEGEFCDVRVDVHPQLADYLFGRLGDLATGNTGEIQDWSDLVILGKLLFPGKVPSLSEPELRNIQRFLTQQHAKFRQGEQEIDRFPREIKRYAQTLFALSLVEPQAREVVTSQTQGAISKRLKIPVPFSWQLETTDLEPWIQWVEKKVRQDHGDWWLKSDAEANGWSILALTNSLPQQADRLRGLAQEAIQLPYLNDKTRKSASAAYFPLLLAFPDLIQFFPYEAKDVPAFRRWVRRNVTEKTTVDGFVQDSFVAIKNLIVCSAQRVGLNSGGHLIYEPRIKPLAPAAELPHRSMV